MEIENMRGVDEMAREGRYIRASSLVEVKRKRQHSFERKMI